MNMKKVYNRGAMSCSEGWPEFSAFVICTLERTTVKDGCAVQESFVRGGPIQTIFLVDEMKEDQNTTNSGQPLARQRNAIEMAFRWARDDGPTLNAGLGFQRIRTSLARKPYIFMNFQGGGGPDPLPPSGSVHELLDAKFQYYSKSLLLSSLCC